MPLPRAPTDCVTLPTTATSRFMNRPGSALISLIFLRSHAAKTKPNVKTATKYAILFVVMCDWTDSDDLRKQRGGFPPPYPRVAVHVYPHCHCKRLMSLRNSLEGTPRYTVC